MKFFNIRILGSEDIPQGLLKPGLVSILGDPGFLAPYAEKVYSDILNGIDIKSTFYHYDLRVKGNFADLSDYLEANVICPLPNLVTGYTELVAASASPDELGLAVVAVMNEVENATRQYTGQLLALVYLGAPDEYRFIVDYWFSHTSSIRRQGSVSFRARKSTPLDEPKSLHSEGIISGRKITERQIKEVYDNLPDRYSELYARRNPEADAILRYSLSLMDPNSHMVHLLLEAAKIDRNLLKKLHDTKIRIASQYSIKVKKWSEDQTIHFNDFYRYCIYLVDKNGNERPVKFHNRPSYCIYLMYILDRYYKQDLVADLSYKENQGQFEKLYSEIMLEDSGQILTFSNSMLRRQNPDTGLFRKGRYDDYIKDISDTFDDLVGSPDSMVLKVGHGQFLQILPTKIEIDENLPKFEFV